MDPALHRHAKRLARLRQTSVSGLFESFLRSTESDGSQVDKMLGSAELRASPRGADTLYDALHSRHIARRP
jgi:hypothetical protein